MAHPNFFILYVESPLASADFYTTLLGRPPLESSPGFAMFALDSGVMLGLWKRNEVLPAVNNFGAGAEVALALKDDAAVDELHATWCSRGLPILQQPVRLDWIGAGSRGNSVMRCMRCCARPAITCAGCYGQWSVWASRGFYCARISWCCFWRFSVKLLAHSFHLAP